jgi:hypothetical protein
MLLFIDTEFTGLGQRWPQLISIGLISEDGQHEFYAELAAETYLKKCDPWVGVNILPRLDGGDCIMQPDELRQRLAAWIGALSDVRIACDSQIDFDFLRSTLDSWPTNVDPKPFFIAGDDYDPTMENSYTGELRRHHALDDAMANRLDWIAAEEKNRTIAECKKLVQAVPPTFNEGRG